MSKLTFTPEPEIAEQLQELARITQRPLADLLNDLIKGTLGQIIEGKDVDLLCLCLDGVAYPDRSQAEAAAENYNALNRVLIRENGRFHVRTAFVQDDCTLEFTQNVLLEA
jgi:hypothetical protein